LIFFKLVNDIPLRCEARGDFSLNAFAISSKICTFVPTMTNIRKTNIILAAVVLALAVLCVLSVVK
jgi:hypothetical protein